MLLESLLVLFVLYFTYNYFMKNTEGFKNNSKNKKNEKLNSKGNIGKQNKNKHTTTSKNIITCKCKCKNDGKECDCDCNGMNKKNTGVDRKKMKPTVEQRGRKVHRSEPKRNASKKPDFTDEVSEYRKFEPVEDDFDDRFLRNSYESKLDILDPKAYNFTRSCSDENLCTKCLLHYAKDQLEKN